MSKFIIALFLIGGCAKISPDERAITKYSLDYSPSKYFSDNYKKKPDNYLTIKSSRDGRYLYSIIKEQTAYEYLVYDYIKEDFNVLAVSEKSILDICKWNSCEVFVTVIDLNYSTNNLENSYFYISFQQSDRAIWWEEIYEKWNCLGLCVFSFHSEIPHLKPKYLRLLTNLSSDEISWAVFAVKYDAALEKSENSGMIK